MAERLTRLTYKIAIPLHLVAESCTIYSYHARWPVRKLLDTPSYVFLPEIEPRKSTDFVHTPTEKPVHDGGMVLQH